MGRRRGRGAEKSAQEHAASPPRRRAPDRRRLARAAALDVHKEDVLQMRRHAVDKGAKQAPRDPKKAGFEADMRAKYPLDAAKLAVEAPAGGRGRDMRGRGAAVPASWQGKGSLRKAAALLARKDNALFKKMKRHPRRPANFKRTPKH